MVLEKRHRPADREQVEGNWALPPGASQTAPEVCLEQSKVMLQQQDPDRPSPRVKPPMQGQGYSQQCPA